MEFIGFSGKRADVDSDKIISIAEAIGLTIIRDNWDYDTEVSPGLKYFRDIVKNDFIIQFVLKNKNGEKTTTSNLLTEELRDFHITNSKSIFIELLRRLEESEIVIKKMHVIFSSEWEDVEQKIRFIKCDLSEIEDFFKVNNGWQLIFYSLESQSYVIDFGCPLIFEIHSSNNK